MGNGAGTKDLITPVFYDSYGREVTTPLVYSATGPSGSFRTTAAAEQASFYTSNTVGGVVRSTMPWAQKFLEFSPLSRPLEIGSAGTAWQPGTHTSRLSYMLNDNVAFSAANTLGSRQVAFYTATVNADGSRTLGRLNHTATYASQELRVTITRDENWVPADGCRGTVEEYKDKEGRVVLKRTYNLKIGQTEMLSTYYVYDDFGLLCFVLPRGCSPDGSVMDQGILDNYAYQYRYDAKRRLMEKRIPGKGWESMVYNSIDQLVLSQDAKQLAAGQWTYNKYDGLGRIVTTGIYSNTSSRSVVQGLLDQESVLWESRATSADYSNVAFPRTATEILSLNYYDDYSFPGASTYPYAAGSKMSRGLLTGSKVKVLGTSTMLLTVNYYDGYGRGIKTFQQHYKGGAASAGNYDEITNTYKFAGELESSTRKHFTGAATESLYVFNGYTYDHMARKLDTRQKTGDNASTSNPLVLLSRNVYNEIGQLSSKGLHSPSPTSTTPPFATTVEYTYNERGWLTSLNAPSLFTQYLKYNEVTGATPQYNGNISRQEWTGGKSYDYTYDKLNRLESGISSDGNNESLTYDVMGNIKSLTRYAAGSLVDELTYDYTGTGNRLGSVADASNNTSSSFQLPGTTSYVYDVNGNMSSRTNSISAGNNLSSITYNYLNLPVSMNANGASVAYTYDAAGNKLKKLVTGTGSLNNEYIGGIHYEGGLLKFLSTEVGRVVRNSATNYSYEYTLTDHLGNGRVFFNINSSGVATKIQETDYYAFGLDIQRSLYGTENRYQYNGKEKQEKMYDYGARFYDPVIGRWSVVDPKSQLVEMSSPYVYALNSPSSFVDKDGELPIYIGGKTGNDSERNSKTYWDAQLLATIAGSGIPNPGRTSMFVDGNRFLYSFAGKKEVQYSKFTTGQTAEGRIKAGYEVGKSDFKMILSQLERDPKTGKITEKIQIYTHSRGAAFGVGYTEALLEMIKQNADEFADAVNEIDYVLNMAPHQSDDFSAPIGVKSFSIDHDWDMASGDDMGNNIGFKTNTDSWSPGLSHKNKTFKKEVGAFLEAYKKNNGNKNKLINDFVKRMRSYGITVTVTEN